MKRVTLIMLLAMAAAIALPLCSYAQVGPPGVVGPITAGHCVSWHDPGNVQDAGANCGGTGAPGGSNFSIQYNNTGSFAGLLPGVTGSYCLQWTSLVAAPTLASCTAGSAGFSTITSGTNTTAAMVVGAGASLGTASTGTIAATSAPVSGLTGGGTGIVTFLTTPSSANLAAAITDETGSGSVVFSTAPSMTNATLTGSNSIAGLTLSSITGSTQCLHVSTLGVVTGTGSDCGAGSGAVSSVTAGASGSVSASPTTGAVVVDLASQATGNVIANVSGSSGPPTATSLTSFQSAMTAANAQLVTATAPAGPTNDYAPAGFGTTTAVLYLTPTGGGSTINGLLAGSAMQQVFLVNAEAAGGGDNITLANQASGSTAANRFFQSGNLVIPPGGGVDCLYLSSTINRWWCH